MKKLIYLAVLQILPIFAAAHIAQSAVYGPCGDCHTMHNSQNGSPMAVNANGATEPTPIAHLTRSTCIGCHNGSLSNTGFAGAVPDIFASGGMTLASGSFNETYSNNGSKKHNVTDFLWLSSDEVILRTVTPGRDTSESYNDIPQGANELACAGSKGCHGRHDVDGSDAGITGFHHGSTAFRFLTYFDGTIHTNIKGKGSSDWEIETSRGPLNHNVYFALDNDVEPTPKDSISILCAMCHGTFHGNVDTSSNGLWTRHPTEVAVSLLSNLPSITVDIVATPFGFDSSTYPIVSTTDLTNYNAANGKVVCLSCHRAHGTQNNDILRFAYASQIAGSGVDTGCLGCHVAQR